MLSVLGKSFCWATSNAIRFITFLQWNFSTTNQSENAQKSVNYPSKSNTIARLTAIDLSNFPIDLPEICSQYGENNKTQSSQLKKTATADTGNIISSLRKAMNSKPTQRIGCKLL